MTLKITVFKRKFNNSPEKNLYYANNYGQVSTNKTKEISITECETLNDLVLSLVKQLKIENDSSEIKKGNQQYLDFEIGFNQDLIFQYPFDKNYRLSIVEGLSSDEIRSLWLNFSRWF